MLTFSANAGPLNEDVETGLQSMIDSGDARAIVVGLYDNGETSVASFGQISRDNADSPGSETLFEIGSISKVFTVLLAEEQVHAKRIAWSDTLAMRLPDVEFASDGVAGITLAELASHHSGLPRLPDNMPMADPMNPYAGYDRALLLEFLSRYSPEQLDKDFDYSNLGMGLLGDLAAHASGLPYGEAMRRDVLSRHGMHATGVSADSAKLLAQGFSGGADMPTWDGFDALAGAGALLSTATDMLRFIDVNVVGGDRALTSVQNRARAASSAFGWVTLEHEDDDPILWHNGGTGGYSSYLAIRPEHGTGVVILATTTAAQELTELGTIQITGNAPAVASQDLEPYAGSFQLAPGFVLAIFEEDGRLFGQATGQAPFPLEPTGENEFSLKTASIRVVFNPGEQGFDSIDFHQGGATTIAARVDAELGPRRFTAIEIDADALPELVGQYQLTPQLLITIIDRNQQLFAQLTGQAAHPVFPYAADKFFFKVVDAQLVFERDDSGKVAAVILNQNGQQRAPRID